MRIQVFLACFFFGSIANAQVKSNFIKGSFITNTGEHKEGFIKDETVKDINRRVVFKKALNSKEEVLPSGNIKHLELESGEVYEGFNYLSPEGKKNEYILARQLVKSRLSLYDFYNRDEQLFLMVKDTTVYCLKEDAIDLEEKTMKNYYFRQYVSAMVTDCDGLSKKCENLSYNERQIIKIVKSYNECKNSSVIEAVNKNGSTIKHLIVHVGAMSAGIQSEIAAGIIYRLYFPKFSKGTSLNIAANYFKLNTTFKDLYNRQHLSRASIAMASFYGQQNVLNGNIRPYFLIGFGLSALDVSYDDPAITEKPKGLQDTYGINLLLGGGVEYNIYKGLMLKSEYRFDVTGHLVTVGVAYNFLHSK